MPNAAPKVARGTGRILSYLFYHYFYLFILSIFKDISSNSSSMSISRLLYFPSALLAARESLMAGNWKMNPETVEEAVALAKMVKSQKIAHV